jgi:hypothetical protein
MAMQEPARLLLMYAVLPLWTAAGLADWWCHRATDIAHTSGLKENLLHLVMFGEIGAGMLAVAFLEINAAVLLFVLAVFVLHELTVYWDLHYSTPLRRVGPFEQMVHSVLEILPLLSLALLAVIAWPQLSDWSLRPKTQPLPAAYLVGAAALVFLFNGLPLLQETRSCWKARTTARTLRNPGPR